MDDLLKEFLQEANEHIDATSIELLRFEKDQSDTALVASLFRRIHTIKGACGFLSLPRMGRLTHATETLIGRLRDGAPATPAHVSLIFAAVDRLSALLGEIAYAQAEPEGDDSELLRQLEQGAESLKSGPPGPPAPAAPAAPAAAPADQAHAPGVRLGETVCVSVSVLDRLMGIVSELVLTRNQLLELASAGGDDAVKAAVQNLSSATGDLQDAVMRVRMQPVDRLFATFPRLVRDLSIELGKKIELVTCGAETELDRQVIELIRAPLTHIIRNAADHGIEPVAERLEAGKPESGVIRVSATYDGGQIALEVKDDGRGLDLRQIRKKALAQGLVTQGALDGMSDAEIFQFVMLPGFSTAAHVTAVSGRGVGMDVVRENIHSIGGTVSLNSRSGKGTTVTLRIPLTLAIAPALILGCGGLRFAVPQVDMVEVVGVGEDFDHAIRFVHDAPVLLLRGDVLPIVDLAEALDLRDGGARRGFAVVLRIGGLRFGLLVESIADVQEIVIEPLVGPLTRLGVYLGQTILGDGGVALILDPAAIAARADLRPTSQPVGAAPSLPEAPQTHRESMRLVLFRAGPGAVKALPLSLVTRIESVAVDCLTQADGGGFLMLQEGRLLPVVPVVASMRMEKPGYPLLILSGAGQSVGLLVEEILDVVDEPLHFQNRGAAPGIVGTLSVGGVVVDLLDAAHYLEGADPKAIVRGADERPRVLLVDDRQFFRDLLGPVLLAAGYEVTTAGSGREALALVERGLRIHAVVTDIDMPEMDGYAFARALLQAPGCAGLPVIALASHPTARMAEAGAQCGVRAVVGKFNRNALTQTLGRLLESASVSSDEIERRLIAEMAA